MFCFQFCNSISCFSQMNCIILKNSTKNHEKHQHSLRCALLNWMDTFSTLIRKFFSKLKNSYFSEPERIHYTTRQNTLKLGQSYNNFNTPTLPILVIVMVTVIKLTKRKKNYLYSFRHQLFHFVCLTTCTVTNNLHDI